MSHIIGMIGLVTLIFVLPIFYYSIVNNVTLEMKERELKEVADYVSNSLWNLHILANSSNSENLVTKKLTLPAEIRDSTYSVELVSDQEGGAQYVSVCTRYGVEIRSNSLIFPGLKVDHVTGSLVESGEKIIVAGCNYNSTGSYVWIKEEIY